MLSSFKLPSGTHSYVFPDKLILPMALFKDKKNLKKRTWFKIMVKKKKEREREKEMLHLFYLKPTI